jgi:hypothetical protein
MLSDKYRRALIAVLAVVCAVAAAWLNWFDQDLGKQYPYFAASTLRMFPVLAVLWLAAPELRRGPGAIFFILAVVIAIAMVFRAGRSGVKFIVPAIGVLMFLGYLRRFTSLLGGKPRT